MKFRTLVAALAAAGCAASSFALAQGTSTSVTTRQSISSSGPTVQGTATYNGGPSKGASVDGTAAANDQRLMDEVVSALAADSSLKGANVNVTVDGGRITISGTAEDQGQADHAKQVAEGIAGSGKVTSSIQPR